MNKKQILITSLGNTLEWFDFGLFIFMAPVIGAKFFPSNTPMMATLEALMVFAAGFICRPLGGIFFGYLGDTHGRAGTLRLSVLLISLSTLLIGLLPTYTAIGLASSYSFILLRLLHGISIGGEYSGAMIYLAEVAPNESRGFITSFAATGANIGFLLATLVCMLLSSFSSTSAFHTWLWRLPFILVGVPAFFIVLYRFKLKETSYYIKLRATHHIETNPFLTALRHAPKNLLKILGLTCMSSTLYYVFFGMMPFYLEHYVGMNKKIAFLMQSGLLIIMLFIVPLAGWYGDYYSRKKMLLLTTIGTALLMLPCFYLLQTHSLPLIILSLSIATLLSSFDQGNSLAAAVENCPANVRYSGIAFSYNLGMAAFGGTAPLVVAFLAEKISSEAPAYYLILMALISFIAASTLLSKNKMLD